MYQYSHVMEKKLIMRVMLRLTRVEANIDSKMSKGQGSLKDFFKGRGLGASTASLSNSRLRKTFQGVTRRAYTRE